VAIPSSDHIQSCFFQAESVLLCAASANADQRIKMMFAVGLYGRIGHVHDLPADGHAVRLVPARAEDGAAVGQDAGEDFGIERRALVLYESAKPVSKSDHLHSVIVSRGPSHSANRRVESGAVPPAG
jgi:hypothetical protein